MFVPRFIVLWNDAISQLFFSVSLKKWCTPFYKMAGIVFLIAPHHLNNSKELLSGFADCVFRKRKSEMNDCRYNLIIYLCITLINNIDGKM